MKYTNSRSTDFKKAFIIYFLSVFLCMFSCIEIKAQTEPQILVAQCTISGVSSVTCGSTSTFIISGCSPTNWTTSCGTIQSHTTTSVTISFNSTTCSNATITAIGTTAAPKVVTITAPALSAGTISNPLQTIIYNTIPVTITASGATGGNCAGTYNYQWQQSTDQVNWTNISGATSLNLNFSTNVTQQTYYRRKVTETKSGSIGYSAVATVNILNPGSVSPSTQNINYNTTPATLSVLGVSGGNGTYGYQWQSSPDNSTWTNINGSDLPLCIPGVLTTPTYFRVIVTSNGASASSSSANVNVYPPVHWGSLSSLSQNINYNTAPAALTVSGASGGSGTYTYQWQRSPDNSTWTNINGAVSTTYSPGALTATTYYRVVVTSNGASINSASINVNVYPQINAGSINPSSQSINYKTAPATMSVAGVSGGNGTYNYQWQQSLDGVNWTIIRGAASTTYSPGILTTTTYYQVVITSNGASAGSASSTVNVISPDLGVNFIRVRDILKSGVMDSATAYGLTSPYDVSQTTQYFDGLGRQMQTVAMQQSPLQNDLVSINVYDAFGREPNKYLPYVANIGDGYFKTTAAADQNTFNAAEYPGEQYYSAQTNFEASPLNRVLNTYAPGINWAGSSRGVGEQYLVNTAADSVCIWNIAFTPGSIPTTSSMYAAGTLYKNITTDEAGHQVVEYKDMDGKVVLKKVQFAATPRTAHVGWLCTYYIYDDLDNLRFVIQPQGVVAINSNWIITQGIADELCFRYEYDQRKRMIIKKIPGAGETWMVYDARDRVVMTQDANLRAQGKWMVTVYDDRNRPTATGLLTDMNNRSYHQNLAYNSISYPSTGTNFELLNSTYYDDYSWIANTGASVSGTVATNYTSNGNYFYTAYNASPTYAVSPTPFNITRGMITGTMKKVIGTSAQYLYQVNFYDDRGRVIQTQSINYTGGIDTLTTQYDFTGKPLRTLLGHMKNGNTPQAHTILTKMDYDHGFRLQHIYKNIDGAPADQLIASMQYNELGQLQTKSLGNNVDNLTYDYNIRGWLTGINKNYVAGTTSNYFGMELGYDKTTSVANGNTYLNPQYNGNIEGTVWKSAGDGVNRKYDFEYDNVNRFAKASYLQNTSGTTWDNSTIDFSVFGFDADNGYQLKYDANGNIMGMVMRGVKLGATANAPINALRYTYFPNSNKLEIVNDDVSDPNTTLGNFHDGTNAPGTDDYAYDGNGNLTLDNNKAIDKINYNYLNLPQLIHMNTKGNITYTYDAAGNKLAKLTSDSTSKYATTTLYIGPFVYQQKDTITNPTGGIDTLQFIAHEEGRTRWAWHKYVNGSTAYGFEYDFFEKDHLGNTRMLLTQEKDTANYIATMETANRTTEDQLFANIDATAYPVSSISGYPVDNTTNPNAYVARVNGSNQKAGPSLLLKVMSGDAIDVAVKSFYINNGSNNAQNSSITDVITSLANGLAGVSTSAQGNIGAITQTNGNVYNGLFSFLQNDDPNTVPAKPKAYLNWVLLDDQFNCVNTYPQSGAIPVGDAGILNTIGYAGIPITKNGYLYIWVSNETQNWDVFFDNLSVQFRSGPVLEENHYYPFGLTMAGISDKAVKFNYAENFKRYNGIEYDSAFGLDDYEAFYRNLDPQIGRWWQIDPKCEMSINPDVEAMTEDQDYVEGLESISPYASMNDDPAKYKDPKGDAPCCQTFNDVIEWKIQTEMAADPEVGRPIIEVVGDVAALGALLYDVFSSKPTAPATKINTPAAKPIAPTSPKDVLKSEVKAVVNASGQTASGHPTDVHGNKLGPSGKPQVNVKKHASQKRAKDAARNEGKGAPEKHTNPEEGDDHYHATDKSGNKKPNSTHHEY